jgi:hypothetical protein
MNRRSFLAALAGLTLDPDRLLWIPGRKTWSIPAPERIPEWPEVLRKLREYGPISPDLSRDGNTRTGIGWNGSRGSQTALRPPAYAPGLRASILPMRGWDGKNTNGIARRVMQSLVF